MAFELTKQAGRRLTTDEIAWLTTVTPHGGPAPRPVWFVWDGQAIVVYSMNGAARLRYIEHNPRVTVHFNSGAGGGDILVISGTAQRLSDAPKPSQFPGLLAKYGPVIERMGQSPQWYDDNYGEAILITPERSWGHD
jgi:PPOX class probable F420-dependent enzyme